MYETNKNIRRLDASPRPSYVAQTVKLKLYTYHQRDKKKQLMHVQECMMIP